jgi:hypothetical protein
LEQLLPGTVFPPDSGRWIFAPSPHQQIKVLEMVSVSVSNLLGRGCVRRTSICTGGKLYRPAVVLPMNGVTFRLYSVTLVSSHDIVRNFCLSK